MCVSMHSMVTDLSNRYLAEARRHFYVTPTSYLELISSYKDLLQKQQRAVGKGLSQSPHSTSLNAHTRLTLPFLSYQATRGDGTKPVWKSSSRRKSQVRP